ncbi:MAG: BNR-4 repeat-containing protein [Chitinispirillaceae bacterium]|nr:BNR-4 repeat-containing protein [Chitinispirillaceae bacterium]
MKRYCIVVLALFGLAQGQVSMGSPGEGFTSVTTDGAWCWYQDPRAIYHNGLREKTYIGFIDRSGTVKAWSYDHTTGATEQSTLHTGLQYDDHDAPSLFVRNDGRIMAFYSRHTSDRYLFYRTTTAAEDISSWGPEQTLELAENVTYSHAFHLSDENRTYLFTRCLDWHPTMLRSNDNGSTWTAPVQLIGGEGARPYIKFVSDEQSRIHFAFTDGHPRDEPTNSIYYAYYEKGKCYKANGAVIKDTSNLPVEPSQAERIYNGATNGKAWIWDIALDGQGRPVMVFAVFPNNTNHHYYYARWNGSQWLINDMVNAGTWFPQTPSGTNEREPNYSPGISLDHADPSIAYLSRFVSGQCEIERWTTSDSGKTWDTLAITARSAKRNVRPIAPWPRPYGTRPPAKKLLFWMNGDYVHYTNYSTGIKYCVLPDQTPCRSGLAALENNGPADCGTELYTISGKRLRFPGGSLSVLPTGLYFVRNGQKPPVIINHSGQKPSIVRINR